MSVATITCRLTRTAEDLLIHSRIRNRVFVVEQGLFDGTDQDRFDTDPAVRHVLGYVGDQAAGTVRLYRIPSARPGEVLWKGDRLAVLPEFRHDGLGAPLVNYAVASAGESGGHRMIAYVQCPNVTFFRWLGWTSEGEPFEYVGEPHQKMWIGLR